MSTHYRALISVPIFADDDDAAMERADRYAASLLHEDGSATAGHLEGLYEATTGRVLVRDAGWISPPEE